MWHWITSSSVLQDSAGLLWLWLCTLYIACTTRCTVYNIQPGVQCKHCTARQYVTVHCTARQPSGLWLAPGPSWRDCVQFYTNARLRPDSTVINCDCVQFSTTARTEPYFSVTTSYVLAIPLICFFLSSWQNWSFCIYKPINSAAAIVLTKIYRT